MKIHASAFLLTFACLSVAAPRPKEEKVPDFYPDEGTTHVYKLGPTSATEVVTKVEHTDAGYLVNVSRVQPDGGMKTQEIILSSKEGLFLLEEGGVKFDPPWQVLKFPIRRGDSWESKSHRPDIGVLAAQHKIGETKSVKVSAGTFDAVEVDVTYTVGILTGKWTYYYTAGIGLVKIQAGEFTACELMSAKRAEPLRK